MSQEAERHRYGPFREKSPVEIFGRGLISPHKQPCNVSRLEIRETLCEACEAVNPTKKEIAAMCGACTVPMLS